MQGSGGTRFTDHRSDGHPPKNLILHSGEHVMTHQERALFRVELYTHFWSLASGLLQWNFQSQAESGLRSLGMMNAIPW